MNSESTGFRLAVISALVLLTTTLAWVLAAASANVQIVV
jgi:hypothetical protein